VPQLGLGARRPQALMCVHVQAPADDDSLVNPVTILNELRMLKLRVRLGGSGASRSWSRRVFRVGRVVSRGLRKLNTPPEHTRRPPKLVWARCEFARLGTSNTRACCGSVMGRGGCWVGRLLQAPRVVV
jgi:hypothetical protein